MKVTIAETVKPQQVDDGDIILYTGDPNRPRLVAGRFITKGVWDLISLEPGKIGEAVRSFTTLKDLRACVAPVGENISLSYHQYTLAPKGYKVTLEVE